MVASPATNKGRSGPCSSLQRSALASVDQRVERLLVAVRVRALGFGERLEPVGHFVEALGARDLRHARVHVGVLVRLAGNGGHQVLPARADRQPGRRIADAVLEELEMAVCVARLAFGGRAEQRGNVVLAFDVGLVREIQIATIGLRFACERVAQALLGLRSLESHDDLLMAMNTPLATEASEPPNRSVSRLAPQYFRSIRCIATGYS